MKTLKRAILLVIGSLSVAMATMSSAQTPASPAPQPQTPAPFEMRLGELMNTFILPRHAKLALAGQEANWPLASYVLKELRQSFDGVSKAVPRWNRLPLADMVKSLTTQPLADVEEAIRARDKAKFAAAMASVTRSCNSCHTATDNAFIVIVTPDQSPFQNQNFRPNR